MTGPATGSILDRIVAQTRAGLPARRRAKPERRLRAEAARCPPPRDFVAALRAPGLGLIAEVKKGSPAKGPFAPGLDHTAAARACRDAGAAAISVLTNPAFFAGEAELEEIAAALAADEAADPACPCPPLLRKEFILDPYQVIESRALGADAYLLIAKILPGAAALRSLIGAGADLGMAAFVEVTDEAELETALAAGAAAVGINNRDLHTFREDLGVTERLRPLVPPHVALVAASGVRTRADLERLRACRVDAVLIGEALARAGDVGAAIAALFGRERP